MRSALPGWQFGAICLALIVIFAIGAHGYSPSSGDVIASVALAVTSLLVLQQLSVMDRQTALMDRTAMLTEKTLDIALQELQIVNEQTEIQKSQVALQEMLAARRAHLRMYGDYTYNGIRATVHNVGNVRANDFQVVLGVDPRFTPNDDWTLLRVQGISGYVFLQKTYETPIYSGARLELPIFTRGRNALLPYLQPQQHEPLKPILFRIAFEGAAEPAEEGAFFFLHDIMDQADYELYPRGAQYS